MSCGLGKLTPCKQLLNELLQNDWNISTKSIIKAVTIILDDKACRGLRTRHARVGAWPLRLPAVLGLASMRQRVLRFPIFLLPWNRDREKALERPASASVLHRAISNMCGLLDKSTAPGNIPSTACFHGISKSSFARRLL